MTLTLAILFGLFLAYANGANDNFKGVATLYGSGTTSYKRALLWATVTDLPRLDDGLNIGSGAADHLYG
jgi:inorganic phosphate transporter, PiT family